ncbi:MAG: DNA repair protein RecN [Candidatus Neomarinimicrobiota bacterium]
MIKRISIKDFAIIKEAELDLKAGLTVITGETGAGKSIFLRALAVALSAKAKKTDVRSGCDRAVIEIELDAAHDNQVIRRIISKTGRTRSFINDVPLPEAEFHSKTAALADFHGQHEQQYILNSGTHLEFLDNFCGNDQELQKISACFNTMEQMKKDLNLALSAASAAADRQELLNFQIKEIEIINPQLGEDKSLTKEFRALNNAEDLIKTAARLNQSLSENEHSIYQQLSSALKDLNDLSKFDEELLPLIKSLNQAALSIQDVSFDLVQYANSFDYDKSKLVEIEARLQSIETLKRKYGGSLELVLEYLQNSRLQIQELNGLDESINNYRSELKSLDRQFQALALQLHQQRVEKKHELEAAIESELVSLNMAGARFQVNLETQPDPDSEILFDGSRVLINSGGFDKVEFFLSANPGEAVKPLKTVASGGEVSRIMLAIKTILKSAKNANTLIFDEIDSGLSGQAAEKVADSLVKLAGRNQVICISHLPQIAARALHHLFISKSQTDNNTEIKMDYLNAETRIQAIAELFSGVHVTRENLASAKTLREQARG